MARRGIKISKGARSETSTNHRLRQIEIIHLSDIHFGRDHQFDPELSTAGDRLSKEGVRSLADKLSEDLRGQLDVLEDAHLEGVEGAPQRSPVIACLTGDFAETGAYGEFEKAEAFIQALAATGRITSDQSGVFIVPGNHDVSYDRPTLGERWLNYTEFHNRIHGTKVRSTDPAALDQLHDRIDDLGVLVLCINSAAYVEKGTPDEQRGQITERQLVTMRDRLEKISKRRRESAIKIALIHHHPIVVPPLAEANRDYDAVQRSGQLLSILHDYGFHLLLHGHKHLPLTFADDMRNAFEVTKDHPMMVVAGGSAGSKGLPTPGANTYNLITVKWHAQAGQTRIRVVTRGLQTHNPKTKRRMLVHDWYWRTLREDDRSFVLQENLVKADPEAIVASSFGGAGADDSWRKGEYKRLRRNLAVVEVRPSLRPDQAYEATFWIVPHKPEHPGYEPPVEVTWSAGELFPVLRITRDRDPRFCGSFNYWGPMLIEAMLRFRGGKVERTFIYARVPGDEREGGA